MVVTPDQIRERNKSSAEKLELMLDEYLINNYDGRVPLTVDLKLMKGVKSEGLARLLLKYQAHWIVEPINEVTGELVAYSFVAKQKY